MKRIEIFNYWNWPRTYGIKIFKQCGERWLTINLGYKQILILLTSGRALV